MYVKSAVVVVGIVIMLSITLAVTLSLAEQSSKAQSNILKTYNDTQGRFVVQYPSAWEIAPKNSSFPYYGSTTAIVFKPVDETASPLENTLFSITPMDVGRNSLDRLVSSQIALLQDPSSMYGNLGVEILENNATTVDGLPAKELSYVIHGVGSFEIQTYVIKNDRLYQLTFQTPESKVPYTLPVAQQMIKTLKFNS
ncbi:MAG: hypothetical protein H0U27_08735 [Nitrosopumilus sp.]|nr:hypothetical protein [Nitrosopumilus sp.]